MSFNEIKILLCTSYKLKHEIAFNSICGIMEEERSFVLDPVDIFPHYSFQLKTLHIWLSREPRPTTWRIWLKK